VFAVRESVRVGDADGPRAFGGILVANVLECCPKCSTISRFSKSNYLFRSDD